MSYIPALRYNFLTRFYDPVLRVTLREQRLKQLLVKQVALCSGHRVLDMGCGTGTLTIMLKQECLEAEVQGVDGDPQVLALARAKIDSLGLDIVLHKGIAADVAQSSASFDRIVSSLVFHHLTLDEKLRTLRRCRALLKVGGEIHIADWGKSQNLERLQYLFITISAVAKPRDEISCRDAIKCPPHRINEPLARSCCDRAHKSLHLRPTQLNRREVWRVWWKLTDSSTGRLNRCFYARHSMRSQSVPKHQLARAELRCKTLFDERQKCRAIGTPRKH